MDDHLEIMRRVGRVLIVVGLIDICFIIKGVRDNFVVAICASKLSLTPLLGKEGRPTRGKGFVLSGKTIDG
jgi:hypothetical protein